ncbi:type I-B CRISPR-associated protein Cas7/Csh2 [Desulfobacula toluolica]|uniref:Csh2: CRISPR-associated protein, Csh2 family n=1 Tax=Desulfobacula toluolica (strain DSM 7467 / Tol2) TaxID=651182 RepID=K0NAL7_DESTT|nr:type I-B CRISPR-associated protein Cas7/Csh2 [Desulfobacula toluolica]CCK81114.1 Csh2: CRISPR-associated protein, Csh2 family [Desulfobacula toluolica Tol2]
MSEFKNRTELLFLYDIENANPNGDPNDENKPRIDEETGKNIVTDVRLKRTIRDYLFEKGNDIFVQEKIYDDDGHIQDAKLRAADYLPDDPEELSQMSAEQQKKEISNNILKDCIDVRLFGATIPLDLKVKKGKKTDNVSGSLTYTGPVQFRVGKSLHSVKLQFFKGTGAFASKKDVTKKTFREEYMLPYSLIGFYGIANENAGKHTNLTEDDIMLLKKAMWNGTKGLISRSKFGQMPRLLLSIRYNEPDFFIGELDNLVHLKSEVFDTKIRRPEDYIIDISELVGKIEKVKDKIHSISFIVDEKMQFSLKGEKVKLSDLGNFTDEATEVL